MIFSFVGFVVTGKGSIGCRYWVEELLKQSNCSSHSYPFEFSQRFIHIKENLYMFFIECFECNT